MRPIFIKPVSFLVLALIAFSCQRNPDRAIKNVNADLEFHRFDVALMAIDTQKTIGPQLQLLKEEFKPFFEGTEDIFWKNQLQNEMLWELNKKVKMVFSDFEPFQKNIEKLIKHYRLHTGREGTIHIYTYISQLDFEYPIIVSDDFIFIALDLFLGSDFIGYQSQPQYIADTYIPQNIVIDLAWSLAEYHMVESKSNQFIDILVQEGKKLALAQKLLPSNSGFEIMKYSPKQWDFCKNNEREMWLYLIDQKYLFSNDYNLQRRFVLPAPFSKFDTTFDRSIPGRAGAWLGWQLVNSFLKQSNTSFIDLAQEADNRKIFNQSKYRP